MIVVTHKQCYYLVRCHQLCWICFAC